MNEDLMSGSLWWVGPGCWAWEVRFSTSTGDKFVRDGVAGTEERANEAIEQAKADLQALAYAALALGEQDQLNK